MGPLTRRELTIVLGLGLLVAGLYYGLDALLSSKVADLDNLKAELSGTVEMKQVQDRNTENKKIKKLQAENARLEKLAAKVEKFWPQKVTDVLTFEDITSDLASVSDQGQSKRGRKGQDLRIMSSKKVPPRDLVYTVDDSSGSTDSASATPATSGAAAAGGAGGGGSSGGSSGGSDANTSLQVKYKEFGFSFKTRSDFGQWLGFLMALDRRHNFYRIRNLSLKSLSSARLTSRPVSLDADFTINVYQTVAVESKESSQ